MSDNVISFNKARTAKADRLGLNDYNWADSPMNDFTLASGELKPIDSNEFKIDLALTGLKNVIKTVKELSNVDGSCNCDSVISVLLVAKGRLEEHQSALEVLGLNKLLTNVPNDTLKQP